MKSKQRNDFFEMKPVSPLMMKFGNATISKRLFIGITSVLFMFIFSGCVGVIFLVSKLPTHSRVVRQFTERQEIQNGTCVHGEMVTTESLHYKCLCDSGFSGILCAQDFDECNFGTHNCHPHATCFNTVGSFGCFCNANYKGDGWQCYLDACTSGTHNCHQHATCIDKVGSFQCSCNANYVGNGIECEANFCSANNDLCKNNGTCLNTTTGYNCSCEMFYQGEHCEQEINHVLMATARNWADARKYCQSLGGDLATWGMRNVTVRKYIT